MSVTIAKNSREVIRIERQDYKGHDLINISVFYTDAAGELRPGKHGLAFKATLLPEVLMALEGFAEEVPA